MRRSEDFYIGYRPEAPASLAVFVRRLVLALLLAAAALAAVLVATQSRFDPGVFEYGVVRDFEGVVVENPYPVLRENPPREVGGSSAGRFLLVAEGKHGAGSEVAGLDGKRVALAGTLIYRDGETLIEVVRGSARALGPGETAPAEAIDLGTHTLAGEIVDSKCFFGVMKPGRGKPHRACATRCIGGGIPPVLRVEARNGNFLHLLLTDPSGAALDDRVLEFVAEPIEITGRVTRRGGLLRLAADPTSFRRR